MRSADNMHQFHQANGVMCAVVIGWMVAVRSVANERISRRYSVRLHAAVQDHQFFHRVDNLELGRMSATRIISRLAPWIVPVPTAWFVFAGMVSNMQTPAWVAIVAAVAIELVGLSAVSLGLELRTYNTRKRAKDPAAPVRIAYGIMGGYIVTVIILSILLDAAITLATIARAVFPLLSLAAFGILALEDDHAARVAQVAQDRTQEREERAARKAERAQLAQTAAAPVAELAPLAYACGWGCGRTFDKLQSRAAHMRKCGKRNGHEPEHVSVSTVANGGR